MHQDFDAVHQLHRDGMAGGMELHDLAVAGRTQNAIERIDRNSVAHHFLRENRIGDSLQRHQFPGQRRDDYNGGVIVLIRHATLLDPEDVTVALRFAIRKATDEHGLHRWPEPTLKGS